MPRPMPVSYMLADRLMLNVAMHWYWFHTFSMRFACGSGLLAWKFDSRSVHTVPSLVKAVSTAPGLLYLSTMALPTFLFITYSESYLGSLPCSTYARTNEKVSSCPGARFKLIWCAPMGFQPKALLFVHWPAKGTLGSCNPSWMPTKASRLVSKPSTGRVHANSV